MLVQLAFWSDYRSHLHRRRHRRRLRHRLRRPRRRGLHLRHIQCCPRQTFRSPVNNKKKRNYNVEPILVL